MILMFPVMVNKLCIPVTNEEGGQDLWKVDRSASNNHLLVNCRKDSCRQAAYSPDRRSLAFSRFSADSTSTYSRIWLLDITSGEVTPLYEDESRSGSSPLWSPDGRYLAYKDEHVLKTVVLDFPNS